MAGARPDTWMPMFWGDYLKDTGHLSTLEHGAYLLLIGHYWSSGTPLPDDDAKLRRIAKVETAAQWRKVRPSIVEFFAVGGGMWRHGRVDRELDGALKRSTDAKAKAEKAAKARWSPPGDEIPEAPHGADEDDALGNPPSIAASNPPSMPEALLEDCPPQPQSSSYEPAIVETVVEAASSVPRAPDPDPPTEAATAGDQQSAQPETQVAGLTEKGDDQPGTLDMPPMLAQRQLEDRAYRLWSKAASEMGWPDAGFLSSAQRPMLAERLAEAGGLDGWKLAIGKAREAQYLRNDDDTPKWWVNLKWFVDPGNFTGLMEGRYAERHRDKAAVQRGGEAAQPDGISAAFARRSVLARG